MLNRLLKLALQAGVEVRWNTPVGQVGKGAVKLSDGLELQAENILLATNGFTAFLMDGIGIRPARGYVFVTKPLPEVQWKGSCHYDRGFVYFRDMPENRMLIGGARNLDIKGETSTQNIINPVVKDGLMRFANEKLRLPQGWEIEQEWTGIMGFSSTKTPECRKVVDGVYVAAGLGGMGVAIGMELGRKAAGILIV